MKQQRTNLLQTAVVISLTVGLYYASTHLDNELGTALLLNSFLFLFVSILGIINSIANYLQERI